MMVNYHKVIFVLVLILFTVSCTDNNGNLKNYREKSKKATQLSSRIQKSNHYTYYIPKDSSIEGVLIIMDPHGKPNLVLDSLHSFSDQNHLALLGLKEIENGISNYNSIIKRDLQHFLSLNNLHNMKIYLLGFSGAARMALIYSQRNRINGLIVCGAGLHRQTSLPFPTVMISGLSDFNFIEQYYTSDSPRTFNRNSIAIHFKGKHQWPPIYVLDDAIQFIINRNSGKGSSNSRYYEDLSKKYYSEKEYFLSFKSMEVAYKLCSVEDIKTMRKKLVSLSNDTKVKLYFQRQNKYLSEEQKRYQMLSESLEVQDLKWWNNQINYIIDKSNSNKNELAAQSYSRTLAYLGILMYSRLNAVSAGRGHYDLFPKYLSIYEKLEPDNPDLYFFKGIYAYTQGRQDESKQYLKKSLQLGFTDKAKMNKYFSQDFLYGIL